MDISDGRGRSYVDVPGTLRKTYCLFQQTLKGGKKKKKLAKTRITFGKAHTHNRGRITESWEELNNGAWSVVAVHV